MTTHKTTKIEKLDDAALDAVQGGDFYPAFTGGVYVAVGDVNGDGTADAGGIYNESPLKVVSSTISR